MEKILSLIIPTYNMERYLNYCLDSLLIDKNLESIEVLVINDGSIDNSLSIARSYEAKYPTVFRVIDKQNANYGSCINRGLQEATGKYIKVLDADDSFDKSNFEEFVALLQTVDVDLLLSDIEIVNEQRERTDLHAYELPARTILKIEDIVALPTFQLMQMHAVTYRRANLLSIEYQQTEGISYTDLQWIFLPMITVKTVYRYEKPIYRYLVGRAGQTMDPAVRIRQIGHLMKSTEGALAMCQAHKDTISDYHRIYLFAVMTPLVKNIYISLLTHYNEDNRSALIAYDARVKELSVAFYEYIGSSQVSSFLGFRYIDYWRRYPHINIHKVRLLSCLYLLLIRGKRFIKH